MVYPAYLLCLLLMMPAFGLTALIGAMLIAADPKRGLWSVLELLGFFGAGIAEPLRYGWRIIALIATLGFVITAGAIPQLRTLAFYGLGVVGTICIAFCLFAALREGRDEMFSALVWLVPSLAGVAACVWYATKFGQRL